MARASSRELSGLFRAGERTAATGLVMRVAYCVHGIDERDLARSEFYLQDFEILKSLGHRVEFVNRAWRLRGCYDLAFVWWWNYLWLWGPLARSLRVPIVTTGALDVDEYAGLPVALRGLKRFGSRLSAVNVFVSRFEQQRVPHLLGLKTSTVRYSPLVVDTREYRPSTGSERHGIPFTVLNVTWQHRPNIARKMIVELLEAFSMLKRHVPDARLILAGPPQDGGELLRRRADQLGVAASVSFPGEVSRGEKIRLMQESSLYCQVSRYEGFGLAVAEAMACGAPVLVSRAGAFPEVVGECGLYVDELSVEGIYQGLRECQRDFDQRLAKAERGVSRIRSEFSTERRREDLRVFLEEALETR